MLSELLTVAALFFFVVVAIGACTLVGSLLYDLLPVLRDGNRQVRHPLVFPEMADKPAVREPARVYRITPQARQPMMPAALRAAA